MTRRTSRHYQVITASLVATAVLAPAFLGSAAHAATRSGGRGTASTLPAATPTDYSFNQSAATMADVRRITRADIAHQRGYTGKGVGIALIDTGVAPVEGLTSGNVVNGPDLSLESQVAGLRSKDTYGHGTHMAGIIAGRDANGGPFRGIAPDAKLTSIKVGMANGAVDVTQVLAAIDWAVAHRNDDQANPIRIINLSYGTDSSLFNVDNALAVAAQNARKAGILVVVAAGNTGNAMTAPASDPYVLTVGATDMKGTTSPTDDALADFSSRAGSQGRAIDIVAPGRSIVSLRDPGSYVDVNYPSARVGDRFFKGSGSSQAAAVVSGAAALFLQKNPGTSPDDVKCNIYYTARTLTASPDLLWGALDMASVIDSGLGGCGVTGPTATGSGGFQAARGTSIVTVNGASLTGERDIFGPLDVATWARASTAGTAWSGGNWMGRAWTGTGWGTSSNGQATWAGRAWSGRAWSGRAWSDLAWASTTWTGRAWSAGTLGGPAWTGVTWASAGWLSGTGKWMY